jgi:hypothetical protein
MPSKKKKSGKKAPALVEGIELAEIAQEPESCHDASAERGGNTGEDALLAGVDQTPQVTQEQQAAAQVRGCDEVREPDPTPAPAAAVVAPPRPPGDAEESNGKDGTDFAAHAAEAGRTRTHTCAACAAQIASVGWAWVDFATRAGPTVATLADTAQADTAPADTAPAGQRRPSCGCTLA